MADAATAPSRAVELDANLSSEEALRLIGQTGLALLGHNETLALNGEPEGVHQMRVSIRRLRAALSGLRKDLPVDDYKWVNRELGWMAEMLGAARDIDVFTTDIVGKVRDKMPSVAYLETPLKRYRQETYDAVKRAIVSPRYMAFKLGFASWLQPGNLHTKSGDSLERKLRKAVPVILDRRYDESIKLADGFVTLSEKKRHALRISLKKLRYSAEIFGTIYEGDDVRGFVDRLKQIQDDLGDANDVTTGWQIVKEIAGNKVALKQIGKALMDWHEDRIAEGFNKTCEHVGKFLETPPFWQ